MTLTEILAVALTKSQTHVEVPRSADGVYFFPKPPAESMEDFVATPDELEKFVKSLHLPTGEEKSILNGYRHQYETPLPRD